MPWPAQLVVVALLSSLGWPARGYESSCLNRCGGRAGSCWCNDACLEHQDCCSDYEAACGGEGSCKLCDGYSCDEWIRWDPTKYSCESLQQDWGCDCSGCSSCRGTADPEWPRPPKPAGVAQLRLFSEAKYPDARCLDGSMAGIYVRKGAEPKKFLIFFEGGGWCYDASCSPSREGTIADCRKRSLRSLGSSRGWRQQKGRLTGMLSADAGQNPVFHNWTLVYVPYCDGTSWLGNAQVDGLFFKGKAVLDAVLTEVEELFGPNGADRVVVSGGSAGASAVYFHVDAIAERFASKAREVLALPDAAFFLNLPDTGGQFCWPDQMTSLLGIANASGALPSSCLARYPTEQWRCLFPEYYADLLKTRFFVINSLYDSSEIEYTLRVQCRFGPYNADRERCPEKLQQLIQALAPEHIKAWAPLVAKAGNGIWAPACVDHTMTWNRWLDNDWEVPARSGWTIAAAVGHWLQSSPTQPSAIFQDNVSWPYNRPCAGDHVAEGPQSGRPRRSNPWTRWLYWA